jgi:hypothetical protein
MNDIIFFIVPIVTFLICTGIWCGVRELFNRWVNNDWCKHEWDMWEAVSSVYDTRNSTQLRFCKKCNKAERRLL